MSAGLKEIRVVLLGKTGVGKSSLGNTLLGREAFEIGRGLSSGTEVCQNAERDMGDKSLQVTDTPGLCDTHRPEEEVLREVAKSLAVSGPGPHAVLLVLRCDRRFTAEEYEAICLLKRLFGPSVLHYSIVVFAGIDGITSDPGERQKVLREMLKNTPDNLGEVLSECSHRYFAVDNRASREDRTKQAEGLWEKILELVQRNGGNYFQNEMLKNVHRNVDSLIERLMSKNNTTREQATRETRYAILHDVSKDGFLKAIIGIISGMRNNLKELCSIM